MESRLDLRTSKHKKSHSKDNFGEANLFVEKGRPIIKGYLLNVALFGIFAESLVLFHRISQQYKNCSNIKGNRHS